VLIAPESGVARLKSKDEIKKKESIRLTKIFLKMSSNSIQSSISLDL